MQGRTDLTKSDRAKLQNHIRQCGALSDHWRELEEICNILAQNPGGTGTWCARTCVSDHAALVEEMIALDWENAGYGSPVVDLAQSPDIESLPDLAASPDLDSYHSVVREHWKTLDFQ